VILLSLAVTLAHAGLIDALTEEQRQVRICADAALPHEAARDWKRAAIVWEACSAECARLGLDARVPELRDQVAVLTTLAAVEPLRVSDPHRWAMSALRVVSLQESVRYPTALVEDLFRGWMTTEGGKAMTAPVRSVSVFWEGSDRTYQARFDELVRASVEDLGLRWAAPGAPDTGVILFASPLVRDLEPRSSSRQGSLARVEVGLKVRKLRFPRVERDGVRFDAVATAESANAADARDEAMRAAAREAAAQVLKQVLRSVFANEEAPR
jgi:hypothetical protein